MDRRSSWSTIAVSSAGFSREATWSRATTSVLATSLREAREETGVAALEIANEGRILDLDVHPIPATPKRPAHVHHDLRYLLTTRADATVAEPLEIEKVGWFSMEEALASGADESLARALRKAQDLLKPIGPSGHRVIS